MNPDWCNSKAHVVSLNGSAETPEPPAPRPHLSHTFSREAGDLGGRGPDLCSPLLEDPRLETLLLCCEGGWGLRMPLPSSSGAPDRYLPCAGTAGALTPLQCGRGETAPTCCWGWGGGREEVVLRGGAGRERLCFSRCSASDRVRPRAQRLLRATESAVPIWESWGASRLPGLVEEGRDE